MAVRVGRVLLEQLRGGITFHCILLISSFLIRLSVAPFFLSPRSLPMPAIGLFLVLSLFYYPTRVRVRSQRFSLSSPLLSCTLSVCVAPLAAVASLAWFGPVLIYFHHYLVSGEDKHAFACLMNQTPAVRPRCGVHVRVRSHARAHLLPAPAGLCLLVCDMESPAVGNHRRKHGQYMTAGRHRTHLNLARWLTIRGYGIFFKEGTKL